MPVNFSELILRSISYEIRYDNAYLLWDRAGDVSTNLRLAYPELKMTQASPGNIAFSLGRQFTIAVNIDRSAVSGFRVKKDLEEFKTMCQLITDSAVKTLGVAALSRIGIRPIYAKSFKDKESAGIAMMESGLIKVPDAKIFNVGKGWAQGEFGLRREDEAVGYSVKVVSAGQKIEFKAAVEIDPEDIPDVEIEKNELMVDVDYYTTATTPAGLFKATDWINSAMHTIQRDTRVVLGGA